MRVVLDSGTSIELGDTEATPTIGITDYSRRVTDDYGVTTVVERAFSRRMSVKLALPFDGVSTLQQRLANLRASSALWVADEQIAWLSVRGFYKEFDLDHAVPPLSYCTLTVEGLAETATVADTGIDPAVAGTSTLLLLQPVTIADANLVSSTVPENDAPEWSAQTAYPMGAQVIKAATHRIYESATAGNVGNDPAGASGLWIDVGPTNRWAIFDQALGTSTTAATSVAVTINASAIQAVALLDVTAANVRVQAAGYDRTVAAGAGAVTFLDLPAGITRVTVTVTGSAVAIGTLLVGKLVGLGTTEASPSAGITDFSRKVVDDFGDVTIVERAWSKRMTAKALIRTDAVDVVANRIATERAQPSLWIGQTGLDSLTVYGFFKDFSIEVGINVSMLSLSIEGLSKAAPIVPAAPGSVAWPDVTDPDGTKPDPNADVTGDHTSKDTNAVGGKPAVVLLKSLDDLEKVAIPAVNAAVAQADARITATANKADAAVADANAKIGAAQLKLDDAVTDLANEIARAQGKDEELVQRINSLAAEGGYDDTNVRALIERAETARADGDRALAERIDTVVTSYRDLDTATNTRVTDTARALASATTAVGERASVLESQASPSGGNLVPNSSLSTLDGWVLTFNPELTSSMTLNRADQPFMIGGIENNLTLHRPLPGTGLCSEAQSAPFAVRQGSSIQLYAMTACHRCRAWVTVFFFNDSGYVGYAGENPAVRINAGGQDLNAWDQTGAKEYVVPAGAVRATIAFRSYDVENDGYAWFSRPFVTEVKPGTNTWVPYSPGNDRTVTASTRALVSSTAATLADADQALGRRIDTVTADYTGRDATTNVRLTDTATALASADQALGQRIDAVQSSFTTGGGNLLSNTEFVTTDGWFENYNMPRPNYVINAAGDLYHPVGENVLSIYQPGSVGSQNYYADWISAPVAVIPGSFLQFSAMFASHRADTQAILCWVGTDGVIFDYAYGEGNSATNNHANDPSLYKRSGVVSIQAPARAVAARLLMRKLDTYAGQGDSFAWFWRPYIGAARQGQNSWNDWSPGNARVVQVASDARVATQITTLADADRAIGQRIDSVVADYQGRDVNTNARVDGQVTALADARQALGQRSNNIEASLNDARGRLSTVETATTDGRFVDAQRASNIEASLNDARGRLSTVETATTDGRFVAVQRADNIEASLNSTRATVSQQAGAIVDLQGKATAYVRLIADAGNGRAALSLWSDQYGGAWSLQGNGLIDGDLTLTGSLKTGKLAPNAVTASAALAAQNAQVNVNAEVGSASATIITSSSSAVRIEYKCLASYYPSQGGTSGGCYGTVVRIANGVETAVLAVRFGSNTFTNDWAYDFPPEGQVTYVLRFRDYIATGSGGYYWSISQIQLGILGFKR